MKDLDVKSFHWHYIQRMEHRHSISVISILLSVFRKHFSSNMRKYNGVPMNCLVKRMEWCIETRIEVKIKESLFGFIIFQVIPIERKRDSVTQKSRNNMEKYIWRGSFMKILTYKLHWSLCLWRNSI